MATYLSPGVHVEETPPAARAIAGVGTSTAAFAGEVPDNVKMPLRPGRTGLKADGTTVEPADFYTVAKAGDPVPVTSWEEFRTAFGDFQSANAVLAHAVFGFFNNGGSRCWVIRAAAKAGIDDPTKTLAALEAIDEIAIVAVPGAVAKAQHDALIAHCSRLQDRVAILDGAAADPPVVATIRPAGLSTQAAYAALYFPFIKVADPLKPGDETTVAPSGHIAGIYARSDAARGVHKAPANEVILGALGVTQRISQAQQDGLNPENINVLRVFNGAVTVWGARTMASNTAEEFRYISTRRFTNFLRESLTEGLSWVVFEPNSPALWQRITRNAGDFLTRQWRAGALLGAEAGDSFFVRCDASTNPPDVREIGQVVTEIGVAVVKPAEFVVFRIQQLTGG
ncbi:hypothetical protein Ait01nite_081970 [Actinoplanes italicus]|uniref:Tail sheath protein C-terminal domain-containing protein n=1 Tax=Actinoplanes italicus TaxID=113567 RepID=A0A2T0K377_9ACTN|nr:phage tail sheath subtilisin-like domain-containing protein [Actinoplanes italicus]PRX17291.1 hypothetical protein CLV67_11667 [Actinoplanes italicus]GIE35152.1 hypothetical protein Ait01nite_081970 [Actinoplanes italicus]